MLYVQFYVYHRNQVSKKKTKYIVYCTQTCEICKSLKIHEHAKDNLVDYCEICQTYSINKKQLMLQEFSVPRVREK